MIKTLIKSYGTRNPFEIASCLDITVLYENLGKVKGFYNAVDDCKFIHINGKLSEREREIVAAHELGHALLHPDTCTPFMREMTFYSVDKLENEANGFAAKLLISDEDIINHPDFTVEQISSLFGVPYGFAELRIKLFQKQKQE